MASYRIVCTRQEPAQLPHDKAHIVVVGTGNDSGYDRLWPLSEVLSAMDMGNTFYTQGKTSGKIAYVEKYTCPHCRRTYIRSKPDAVSDNNLDNLPGCKK